MIVLSAGFFSLVLADSVLDALRARQAAIAGETADDPNRTAAIRKRFEELGLTLHDGMYWKEVK